MLAKAARAAGFTPLVIDAYGDADTRAAAAEHRRLHFRGPVIDMVRLGADLESLENRYGRPPICWGSGWESSGHLLRALACRYRILGSSPRALLGLARPGWHDSLRSSDFAKPDFSLFAAESEFLVKDRCRAGGYGVDFSHGQVFLPAHQYRQRFIKGESLSVLCCARGEEVAVIGWSEHFNLQSSAQWPFRHSAVITRPAVPCNANFLGSLTAAAKKLGLSGLFGADLIIDGEDELTIVEINPRPTASVPLHLNLREAFKLHIQPELSASLPAQSVTQRSRANAVVYADSPIRVTNELNWPPWVSDVPSDTRPYADGEPLCSIRAEAADVEAVKRLLEKRLEELLAMFQNEYV